MAISNQFAFNAADYLDSEAVVPKSAEAKTGVMSRVNKVSATEEPKSAMDDVKARFATALGGFFDDTQALRDTYYATQASDPTSARGKALAQWESAMQSANEAATLRSERGITRALSTEPLKLSGSEAVFRPVARPQTTESAAASFAQGFISNLDSAEEAVETSLRPKSRTEGLMARPSKDLTVPEYKVYDKPQDMSELEILARTIEAEARNEPFEGKIAVGATIANRAASGKYGQGIHGVILKKAQFSPWNAWTGYAKGEQGKDMMKLKASKESYQAAQDILKGDYEDVTGGATHYLNDAVSKPAWLPAMKKRDRGTLRIGNHLFGNADSNKTYNGKAWVTGRDK